MSLIDGHRFSMRANILSGESTCPLHKMFLLNTRAELWIVQQQQPIGKLRALLHKVQPGPIRDFALATFT